MRTAFGSSMLKLSILKIRISVSERTATVNRLQDTIK